MPACTFFGHHDAPNSLETKLLEIIKEAIDQYGVRTFYVGNQGNFDAMALRSLQKIQSTYAQIHYSIVFAYLPNTTVQNTPSVFPEGIENVPHRFRIPWRNKWMISQCEYVISYVSYTSGQAAKYVKIAKEQGKHILSLTEGKDSSLSHQNVSSNLTKP